MVSMVLVVRHVFQGGCLDLRGSSVNLLSDHIVL